MSTSREKLRHAVAGLLPELYALHARIHRHPEVSLAEHQAASWLQDFLRREGFKVRSGLAGLATAFRADAGEKTARPRTAFLAEYDALPGLGHACGHSIIAAGSAGAAAALHRAFPALPVTVVGTPAEEIGAGKIPLIRAGAFRGIAFALMAHPSSRRRIVRLSLGVIKRRFTFLGRSAHAAAHPEEGINALDAAVLFYTGVSSLRQQRPERVRIHLNITAGGEVINVIPARAEVLCAVRALDPSDLMETLRQVEKCAVGAARAAGARLRIGEEGHLVLPLRVNRTLAGVYEKEARLSGYPPHPGPEDRHIGSSDVGNLSWVMPVIHPHVCLGPPWRLAIHTPEFEKAAGGKKGRAAVKEAATLLALTAWTVIRQPALWSEIRREFRAGRNLLPSGLAGKPINP